MQESQEAFLEEMLLTLHILVHPQCWGYSGTERCARWLSDRAWHVQGHAGSPGNHAWKQLVIQICNSGLAVGTDLRGINRQISLGNVMPGLSLWEPLEKVPCFPRECRYWHQDGACTITFGFPGSWLLLPLQGYGFNPWFQELRSCMP